MAEPEPDLLRYVEAIERRLTLLQGREHVLSPHDFDLARRWQRAGVSLAAILEALEQARAAGESHLSLGFVARRVEARHKRRPL